MIYEGGELRTSKWGPNQLSTPREGLLPRDCQKPENTGMFRTTAAQCGTSEGDACSICIGSTQNMDVTWAQTVM